MGNLISNKTYDYNGLDKNEIIKKFGIQNVYTPIDKIEEIIGCSFIDFINEDMKKIGILYNTEFLEKFIKSDYIKNNEVEITFCYDSEFDKRIAEKLMRFYKYDKIELISIIDAEKENDWNKIMAGKKFDVVFSNPPYNDNLDLKILEHLFKISENIVFVHPSVYILDKRFVKNLYNNIRNTNYLKRIIFFWGNELFNIALFMPLCISYWSTNKNNDLVTVIDNAFSNKIYKCKINDVSVNYGSTLKFQDDYKKFINKIKSYPRAMDKRVKPDYSDMTRYSIKLASIRGHISSNGISEDFFSYCSLDLKNNFVDETWRAKRKNDGERLCWSFKDEIKRLNFANYLKTKTIRFIESSKKISQNYDMDYVPWLDFTQEWNDAKLCKEFNISKELWNYINNFIPDYYDDYKSGFEEGE